MNDWQVGRITFGPLDRLASKLRGFHKQGDVIIPIKPVESKPTPPASTLFTAQEIVDLTYRSCRHGENVSEIVEDLANRLGYFGGCEPEFMNGDVCTKKNCRQCFVADYKQIIAMAVVKDTRITLADLIVEKSSR